MGDSSGMWLGSLWALSQRRYPMEIDLIITINFI